MTNFTKLLLGTAAMLAATTLPAFAQKGEPVKPKKPAPAGEIQAVKPAKQNGQLQPVKPPKTPIKDGQTQPAKNPFTTDGIKPAKGVKEANRRGYVLTHEHPMIAMSIGGNYAFTGSPGNFANGIMENGYTARCSGCSPASPSGTVGTGCDHGEWNGFLFEKLGLIAPDIRAHSAHYGPKQRSWSHVKYSTEWVREAFDPPQQKFKDARMRIMVAYAMENEVMCDALFAANVGNGGPGGDGFSCQRGDSFNSMSRQIQATKDWAAANSGWMEVAYTAADARRIVESGKLAIIIGIEADYAFGAENQTFDVVDRLNQYHDMGVRTFYPSHKLNSRLGGADIYRADVESPGKLLRANQAFAGCFYVDDNAAPFPLLKNPDNSTSHNYCDNDDRCGENHFRGTGLNNGCNADTTEFSELTMGYLIEVKPKKLNGFKVYPKLDEYSDASRSGSRDDNIPSSWSQNNDISTVEYNNLGMTRDGRRVMAAAMKKGMLITLDHISKQSREELAVMAAGRNNYPLNAFHNNPNEILIGGTKTGPKVGTPPKKFTTQYPSEYDFDDDDINMVVNSNGFFGARLGPIDVDDGMVPDTGVARNCPGTATENAKALSFLLRKGLNVGYSLDYSTVTQGTYSASYANCGEPSGTDFFDRFVKNGRTHTTQGLSHMGMMKKFHQELERVGLNDSDLNTLRHDGVEQFLQMWEASEARGGPMRNGQPVGLNPNYLQSTGGTLTRKNP